MNDELTIPIPVSSYPPKSNWRDDDPEYDFGHKMLDIVDPERDALDPEQQRAILRLEDEEALKALLYADLGNVKNPDIAMAERVFGNLLMRELELPPMLMSWQFYTIVQCQNCIDAMAEQMKDKTLTGAERVNAGKARLDALKSLSILISNAAKLAKAAGLFAVVKKPVEKPVEKKPKNEPPSF